MKRIASIILVAALQFAASAHADSRASIEQAFDRNKGGLYAIYARELRSDPTLKGKIVFEIDIAADGLTTDCRVRSSELNSREFEANLCARIKLIRFSPMKEPTTIVKPIDFFPAA